MKIAWYITAHGFGHFVRQAAVVKELPGEIPVVVRSAIPEWFLSQELAGRPYESFPAEFDVGTVGRDSTTVDVARTFDLADDAWRRNQARLDEEVAFLRENRVRVVVCDAPSFPLVAAGRAGVPSMLVTNFTWVEIYRALAERVRDEGDEELARRGDDLVARFAAEYAAGDVLLTPGMALEMSHCRRRIEAPIIARTGVPRRELLREALGMDPDRPMVLVYLGREGYEGLDWSRAGELEGFQFFSFTPLEGAGDLVKVIPQNLIDHADATATADAIVGKLGYSLCAEAAATRTPLVFPPRPFFVEARALGKTMLDLGLGVPLKADDFRRLEWRGAIERALGKRATALAADCSGARLCAEIVHLAWREGTLDGLVPGSSRS